MATSTSKSSSRKQELLTQFRTIIAVLTLIKAPHQVDAGPSVLQVKDHGHKMPALDEFEKTVQKTLKAFVDASTRDGEVLAAAANIPKDEHDPGVAPSPLDASTRPLVNAAGAASPDQKPATMDGGSARTVTRFDDHHDQEIPYEEILVVQDIVTWGIVGTDNAHHRHKYFKESKASYATVIKTSTSEWCIMKDVGKKDFLFKIQ